ncbi:MAG: GDYXXLXY domain-containing protein [Gammaproteobacteria bacterium]|nr:GDYXXLXY domain-containing protein [Gammaproteobacteria bacterium]
MMRKWLIALSTLLILGVVNSGIWSSEKLLQDGEPVLLELAPLDPRSLMQGDYMALRFAMTDAIKAHHDTTTPLSNGMAIVELDAQRRASFVALDQQQPLTNNQLRLQFRLRQGQVKFATNAFFFQEGTGDVYAQARYGLFRVNQQGQMLLTHLVDAQLQPLGQAKQLQPNTQE